MAIKLYNKLSKQKENFKPIKSGEVGIYTCGPTVYDYTHIGNLRAYIFADVLHRMFKLNGNKVTHIINITDVGHLTSDADEGEDKVERAAKEEGRSAKDITSFYTSSFFEDLGKVRIDISKYKFPKATDHIKEQIKLIKKLEEKGYTYKTSDGVYFDSSKFEKYADLAKLDIAGLKSGARIEEKEKKNITDFALWKFSGESKRQQEWDSPWGVGFPGWHIECSAMSMKYLGKHFDIHTGGVEHLPVHHTNERAQSESATGKPFVNYWLHNEHLLVDGGKMAKSEGTGYTLKDLEKKSVTPLAYRYFVLGAHYRSPLNFTWDAVNGASSALKKLEDNVREYKDGGTPDKAKLEKLGSVLSDDLNTPKALALLQEVNKSSLREEDKKATILKFDKVLGLGLDALTTIEIPTNVTDLLKKRDEAREEKNYGEADKLRKEIEKEGYIVDDMGTETRVRKSN